MRIKTTTLIALLALAAPAPGSDENGSGGAAASAQPLPNSVRCAERCGGLSTAGPGSLVRVLGADLDQVARVVFTGAAGVEDDVWTSPLRVRDDLVDVTVPEAAGSGPLVVVTADGVRSAPTDAIAVEREAAALSAPSGQVVVIDAEVETRRAFFNGRRAPALNFMVKGGRPTELTVTLVHADTNTPMATWSPGVVEAGSVRRIQWNGLDSVTGKAAPAGRYVFRVYVPTGRSGARTAQARPVASSSFVFLDHVFPVRGRHGYGEGGAAYGAGRGGRSHRGQDILADCGTSLVAARGGTVKSAGFEGAGGNSVVIDGAGTGTDYVYMHLAEPSPLKKGDAVRTGDPIGVVGRTGNATACLLHFELWSAPGWYTGGRAFDPLPSLRAWDETS